MTYSLDIRYIHFKMIWLGGLWVATTALILIGGLTRLTDSGLSMVEWKPLLGIIPPLNEQDWQETFLKYQAYPQYRKINTGMALAEFKFIFYMEYSHRIMGRVYGLMIFLPLAWLGFKRALSLRESMQYGGILFLAGIQGLVGWFMVKSGLVHEPHVSQYRLALHLSLAILLLSFISWAWLSCLQTRYPRLLEPLPWMKKRWSLLGGFIALQMLFGAFTAGLDAGTISSSFPKMLGYWIPPGLYLSDISLWKNISANPLFVHFFHRMLGLLVFLLGFLIGLKCLRDYSQTNTSKLMGFFLFLLLLQCLLGIAAVMLHVPIFLASLHQMTAVFLWSVWVVLFYLTRMES